MVLLLLFEPPLTIFEEGSEKCNPTHDEECLSKITVGDSCFVTSGPSFKKFPSYNKIVPVENPITIDLASFKTSNVVNIAPFGRLVI